MDEDILKRIKLSEERLDRLRRLSHYRGISAVDFTTTTMPHEGDYGFQTADGELQVNCNGTILKTTMSAL